MATLIRPMRSVLRGFFLFVIAFVCGYAATAQTFPVKETDAPNNTPATAMAVTSPLKLRGNIYQPGDVDYYKFNATAGDKVYAATMTSFDGSASQNSRLTLLGTDGTTIIENDEDNGTFGASSSSIAGATIPATGTYYLLVVNPGATASIRGYDLYLKLQSGTPVAEVEPNDGTATANIMPASGWVSGTRNPAAATEGDFYAVTLAAGESVFISCDADPERDGVNWNPRIGFGQFGDANNLILVIDDAGAAETPSTLPSEALFLTAKNAGTYYVYIDATAAAAGGPTATYNISYTKFAAETGYVNYAATGAAQTIPAATGSITSTLTIPDAKRIKDVTVRINLQHALMQDVDAVLTTPGGDKIALFTDIGASAIGGEQQMDIALNDNAAIPAGQFTVLKGVAFQPEILTKLDLLKGVQAQGTWTLTIYDDANNTSGGTLNGWSMDILDDPNPVPAGYDVLYQTDFEANDGGFTHSGTLDEWEYGTPNQPVTAGLAGFTTANSGTKCWKTDLDNSYENNSNQILTSPVLNLTNRTGGQWISWAMKHHVESASFDSLKIEAVEIGGSGLTQRLFTWLGATPVQSVGNPGINTGFSGGWGVHYADVSAFAGKQFRFRVTLVSDASVPESGVAIDDVKLFSAPCNISNVSFANATGCNDNGTPGDITDDYFTADVTVTYANPPASGTLQFAAGGDQLAGGGPTSIGVGSIGATSYTFTGVRFKADNTVTNVTLEFSASATCNFAATGPTVNNCDPCAVPPTADPVANVSVCNGTAVPITYFTGSNQGIACGTVAEGNPLTLTAPAGYVFTAIKFASYGTPAGSCGNFTIGACHATNSVSIVSAAAIGQNTFTITANNATFGDPCAFTSKSLAVEAVYTKAGGSFTWTNSNPSIGLAASGSGNLPAFTAVNTGSTPVTATIQVTPTFTAGATVCTGTPVSYTITVNPTPSVSITGGGTFCGGTTAALTATAGFASYQWSKLTGFSGYVNIPAATSNIFNATESGRYRVTVTNAAGCSATTEVNVEIGDWVYNGNIAAGDPTHPSILFASGGGAPNTCAVPVGCPGPYSAGGPFKYDIYTIPNSNTSSVCATIAYTVNCSPGLTVSAYAGSYDPSNVCTNYIGEGRFIYTGGIWTFSVNVPAGQNLVVVVSTYQAAQTCGNYRLVVDMPRVAPSITQTPTGAPCTSSPTILTASPATTYSWSPGGATTQTITVNPSVPTLYTVTLGYGTGSCTATASATVSPAGLPTLTPVADQTVCNNANTTPINFTGSPAGTVYTWTNNNTSIGLAASGIGNIPSFTATNSGTGPVTATVTVTPRTGLAYNVYRTHNGSGDVSQYGAAPNNAAEFDNLFNTANSHTTLFSSGYSIPEVLLNWSNASQLTSTGISLPSNTDFFGVEITGTFTAVETGLYSFGIDGDDADDLFINGTLVTAFYGLHGFGGLQYGSINLVAGQTYTLRARMQEYGGGEGLVIVWRRPSQATYSLQPEELGCTGITGTFNITVNPTPAVNAVANQNVCNGAPTSPVTFTTPTIGAVTYSWTNSNGTIGLGTSGTGNIPSFTATNTGTSPVTATITVTPIITTNSVACNGTPITFTITVNPTATVNTIANQVVCNGGATTTVNFGTTATGGTVSYVWANNNTSIGLAASGTSNSIPSFTATNTGTAPVVATITVTPTFTNGSVSCTGTARTFTITVNPTATVTAIANQTICTGSPSTAVTFSSPATGGTITYSWTNSNTAIGLSASGNGNLPSFTATNTTNAPISGTITVTPSYSNGSVTCPGTATTFTITVNPNATVNTVANQVVCNGSPTTAVAFSSPTTGGTIVYNWTNNTTSIGLAASGSGNIPSFTATNTGTAPVVATITVTPAYTNGSVTCNGTARTFTITVNPTATVNAVTNQVVCNGAPTAAVTFSSPTTGGTIVYNWTNSNTSIGLVGSGTGNIPSFNGTNTTSAPISGTITVTPSYTNGAVTCVGTPRTFTITVNPTATINAVANQVVCNGAATAAVTFASPTTGGTIVYNWTNNTPSIGLAATGSGNIASFTAVNAGTAPVTATISVTPAYTNSSVTCNGTPITFTITVNPTAIVNSVANQTVCQGAQTAAVNFSSPTTGGTIVYNWTNSNTAIGLGASGSGNIPAFTATNTTQSPITGTITVTPSYTNGSVTCTGTPTTFTITVNVLSVAPTAAISSSPVICGSGTVNLSVQGGSLGTGAVYRWYTGSCGGTLIGTGATLTNVPVTATTTFYVRAEGTCNTTACASVTVVFGPKPTVVITPVYGTTGTPGSATNNPATPIRLFATTSPAGNYTYQWKRDNTILSTLGPVLDVPYQAAGSYTATAIEVTSGCSATSNTIVITDKITNVLYAYPNPTTGLFNISVAAAQADFGSKRNIMVFDPSGKRIYMNTYTVTIPYERATIDIGGHARGTYVITVTDASGKTLSSTRVMLVN